MVAENKQNRSYKQIIFISLQNNHHPSQNTVGNVHKTSGTVSKGLFRNRSQNRCHTFLDCHHVCKTCAFHGAHQAGKQKELRKRQLAIKVNLFVPSFLLDTPRTLSLL
jgi:hypothetical protein